jgi:hypothetical protein
MFTVTGKLLEKKQFKTKKGVYLDIVVLWVQNGNYGMPVECVDWEKHVNGAEPGTEMTLPCSIGVRVSQRGNGFLQVGIQDKPIELPRQAE